MTKESGMTYAPKGKPKPVVKENEFVIAAIGLDHGHIYGMANGCLEAGATLKWVYDKDPEKMKAFKQKYPEVQLADSKETIYEDESVDMVLSAAIASERSRIGNESMRAGKHYFADKTAFTTLEQLDESKRVVQETGKRFFVYFGERLHVESAIYAGQLIKEGVIGTVIQVTGFGPHRLGKAGRPDWFFEKEKYGGILCDIGSHQIEQFLFYTSNTEAEVVHSKVANYANHDKPGLEDYGDATLVGANGATFYFKVDWFTPDGLSTWGDGRTFITGTKGTIELRKYVDVAREESGNHLYLVTEEGEQHIDVNGKIGYPFFGEMILDCINKTEVAMTQDHIFKAQELSLLAERDAMVLTPNLPLN